MSLLMCLESEASPSPGKLFDSIIINHFLLFSQEKNGQLRLKSWPGVEQ